MTRPITAGTYQDTFPFSFELLDDKEESAIYIVPEDLVNKQHLKIRIRNTSGRPIYLTPLFIDEEPGPTQHHFELRFRTGTLSKVSLGKSKTMYLGSQKIESENPGILPTRTAQKKPFDAGKWLMSTVRTDQDEEWISYYFARTSTGSPWMFESNSTITLTLQSLSAEANIGTRETRVELLPGRESLYFLSKEKQPYYIREPREHTLRVINHIGEPVIPLHVGFIGANTILNDDAPNSDEEGIGYQMELRITNTSPRRTIQFKENSRIHLEFETSEDVNREGAIGQRSNTEKLRFFLEISKQDFQRQLGIKGGDEKVKRHEIHLNPVSQEGEVPFWTIERIHFRKINSAKLELKPKDTLTLLLDLRTFQTEHPAGITFLRMHYENIPGYWDGLLKCPIEITPLRIQVKKDLTKPGDDPGTVGFATGKRELSLFSEKTFVFNSKRHIGLQITSKDRSGTWLKIENNSEKGGTWNLASTGDHSTEKEGKFLIHQEGIGARFSINKEGKIGIGLNENLKLWSDGAQSNIEASDAKNGLFISAKGTDKDKANLTLQNDGGLIEIGANSNNTDVKLYGTLMINNKLEGLNLSVRSPIGLIKGSLSGGKVLDFFKHNKENRKNCTLIGLSEKDGDYRTLEVNMYWIKEYDPGGDDETRIFRKTIEFKGEKWAQEKNRGSDDFSILRESRDDSF